MPHLLHLVRDPNDPRVREVIARQLDAGVRVSVVLLPGAGEARGPLAGDVHRLIEDGATAAGDRPTLDHGQLLELIFAADSVVSW